MTEIIDIKQKGFNSVFSSDSWQIATITYDVSYSKDGFDHMKRHMTTDEVFTLVNGDGVLHTIEDEKIKDIKLEKGNIYCVRKETWHYLEISEDALLVVAENKDLLPKDTERMDIGCLLQK